MTQNPISPAALLLCVFVLVGTSSVSSLATAQELDVPRAAAPVLDGEIGEEEWKGGAVRPLGGGGEARFQRDEDRLYVAIKGRGEGWSHVYFGDENEIRVLHASAALGDAVYRRSSDDRWAPVSGFAWEMRETAMTSEAVAAREAYLVRRGWVATTSGMGDPAEHEFAIDLDAIPAAARIVVLHATDPSDAIVWPSTEDAVQDPGLVRGSTPSELVFEPSSWAWITYALEEAREAR